MIGSSKNSTENYPRKCFWTQEKETWVKFNPGLSANRPSNNWGQGIFSQPCRVTIWATNEDQINWHWLSNVVQILFSSFCRYQMVNYWCFTPAESEMTQNSCPMRWRSSKPYEILLSWSRLQSASDQINWRWLSFPLTTPMFRCSGDR